MKSKRNLTHMKKISIILAVLAMGSLSANAQTAGEKAEKNCIKEKMDQRNAGEKVVDKVFPASEKNRESDAKTDCQLDRIKNEKEFIDKHGDKPKSNQ